MTKIKNIFKTISRFCKIKHIQNENCQRQSYILNIILGGLILLSLAGIFELLILNIFNPEALTQGASHWLVIFFLFLFLILLFLSKKGYPTISASILTTLLLLAALQVTLKWGTRVCQPIAIYALIIVFSGILIRPLISFFVAIVISILLIIIFNLQKQGILQMDNSWLKTPQQFTDIIVLNTTYFVIAIVSWLSSREITKSLNRARKSEKNALGLAEKLQKQKNTLEIKVEARTKELKETQLKELMRINCLAEFGRISAGLLHDIKNPLTVISMNLDSLKHESKKNLQELVNKSLLASKAIEGVIKTSQKQLLYEDQKELFSLNKEIKNTLSLLQHKADRNKVNLIFKPKKKFKIKSYPAKLSRVVANLVMNSIDAFEGVKRDNRFVKISTSSDSKNIKIKVEDNGCGIKEKNKKYIFQPLFSTKKDNNEKSGLGLNISQKIIKDYFKGEITFESTYGVGSSFIITISKNSKNVKHKIKH